jgi:hypothetical protein
MRTDPLANLDEDLSVARVTAALEGDRDAVRLDDAMRRAVPLAERGQLSPFAVCLLGTIYRGLADGDTVEEMRTAAIMDDVTIADRWQSSLDELTRHGLLPSRG